MVGVRSGEEFEGRGVEVWAFASPELLGVVAAAPLSVELRLVVEDPVEQPTLRLDLAEDAGWIVPGDMCAVDV